MDKATKDKLAGHLERMEEDRMPKKILTQQLEGTTHRGRPRKGWREEVARDLQVLGVTGRRELVIDGEKWRGIIRQAKPKPGCSANGRRRSICILYYCHRVATQLQLNISDS